MRRTVLLLIVILLLPALLSAQTDQSAAIEFYGAIQSVTGNTMIINGQAVDLRGAQINAPLDAGTVVHVTAQILEDGTIAAQLINPAPEGVIPGIVEIDGVIDGLSATAITVSGEPIALPDGALDGSLTVGQHVRVFAVATAPGAWSARLVVAANVAPPAATPEVIAPVVTPEVIAPAATPELPPVVVTPEILPPVVVTPEVNPPAGTPEVLPPVVVTPEVNPPAGTPEVGESFRIEGAVQAYDGVTLVVNGQRLAVGQARIDGEILVGEQVRVELVVSNGEAVVLEITVLSGSGSPGGQGGHG